MPKTMPVSPLSKDKSSPKPTLYKPSIFAIPSPKVTTKPVESKSYSSSISLKPNSVLACNISNNSVSSPSSSLVSALAAVGKKTI
jgi:hypothetical protein